MFGLVLAASAFSGSWDADVDLLDRALTSLHPGLHRHLDRAAYAQGLDELRGADGSLRERYLALSRFLARVRCGHTYANFWNQTGEVQAELFDQSRSLPFTFRWLDRRMVVTSTLPGAAPLRRGDEVLSVQGIPAQQLLSRLLPYVKADGANDGKRRSDLGVVGVGRYEAFDVFFPLLLPAQQGVYRVRWRGPEGTAALANLPACTRAERARALADAGLTEDPNVWTRTTRDGVLVLRLPSFTVWNMKQDWRAFLAESFQEAKTARAVLIDIRGNEGGADEVIFELGRYLAKKPVRLDDTASIMAFQRIPPDVRPFLTSWQEIGDPTETLVPRADGRFDTGPRGPAAFGPSPQAISAPVALLVDESNSSATYYLAKRLQASGNATIIGRPTGGSQAGMTGGQFFVLRLPHSGLAVDVPLIASEPVEPRPDSGVQPDLPVRLDADDLREGRDSVLEAALRWADGVSKAPAK